MADKNPKCEEGLPPWLATFADLMSLLMCFFVLLLSFAEVDAIRFKKMAESMKDAFGVQRDIPATEIVKGVSVIKTEFSPSVNDLSLLDDIRQHTTDEDQENLEIPSSGHASSSVDEGTRQQGSGEQKDNLHISDAMRKAVADDMQRRLEEEINNKVNELRNALAKEIEQGLLSIESEEKKIIIRIQEKGSFASGVADLKIGFYKVMNRISEAVAAIPGKVIVAGHTDNVPIATRRFRSNWELSSARAVTVVHALLRNPDVETARILIEGRADTDPLAANDTPENRAKNRRVELMLLRGEDQDSGEVLNLPESGV